jgi:hypothetical protein
MPSDAGLGGATPPRPPCLRSLSLLAVFPPYPCWVWHERVKERVRRRGEGGAWGGTDRCGAGVGKGEGGGEDAVDTGRDAVTRLRERERGGGGVSEGELEGGGRESER